VGVHQLGIGNPLLELKTAASAAAGSRPATGAAGDTLNEVAGLSHKAGLATKTEEMEPPKAKTKLSFGAKSCCTCKLETESCREWQVHHTTQTSTAAQGPL
jgi:hypothetical protein